MHFLGHLIPNDWVTSHPFWVWFIGVSISAASLLLTVAVLIASRIKRKKGKEANAPETDTGGNASPVSILEPKRGATVALSRGSDNEYRFVVKGSVNAVPEGMTLTVWVKPVRPPGTGWYLQHDPVTPTTGGLWVAYAQAGAVRGGYGPEDGNVFSIAAVLLPDVYVQRMRSERKSVVAVDLPDGQRAVAKNLKVRLVR